MQRPTYVRYMVLGALCLVTVINYIQRNSINAAETTIGAEFGQVLGEANGKRAVASAISDFFLPYALLQVPTGWLAQWWGTRRTLALFTVGWSLATAAMAFAEGELGLRGARLLVGAFQAGIFPCATLIMGAWLPPSQRASASGLLNASMVSGSAVGGIIVGQLLGPIGWRMAFIAVAIPGIMWAVWFLLWFVEKPADHRSVNREELVRIEGEQAPAAARPKVVRWWLVILSMSLLMICAQQACRAGANRMLDRLPSFLQETRDLSPAAANRYASLPNWFALAGSLIGGVLSDYVLRHTGSRRAARVGVAVGSIGVSMGIYLATYFHAHVAVAVIGISLAYMISTFASPCAYAITMDLGGRYTAVVFGAMNMFGNLGAWLCAWLVGAIKYYTGSWNLVLQVYLALHVLAMVFWLLINPRRTIGEVSAE